MLQNFRIFVDEVKNTARSRAVRWGRWEIETDAIAKVVSEREAGPVFLFDHSVNFPAGFRVLIHLGQLRVQIFE